MSADATGLVLLRRGFIQLAAGIVLDTLRLERHGSKSRLSPPWMFLLLLFSLSGRDDQQP